MIVCQSCDWEEALDEIDEMLDDERYSFAVDTLEGIKEWVAKAEHVTDKQKEAVDNIRGSVE